MNEKKIAGIAVVLALLILAVGCASHSKVVRSSTQLSDRVFPLGIYKHDVELAVTGGATGDQSEMQRYRFNGVVKLETEKIQVVALSPMGTTVFTIVDNLKTGEVKTEIYVERMKPHQARLLEYYAVIKKLLLLKAAPNVHAGAKVSVDKETEFLFGKYDAHQIPETVWLKAAHYDVHIEVTDYEI